MTTYCVVNVPFAGQSIEIPYICGQILLDGANLSFMGLIQEIPTDEVRMGMRVEAVWAPPEELGADVGLGQVLPPHRRARRRLRDLQGVPVSRLPRPDLGSPARRRGVLRAVRQRAARGRAQRGRDAHAGGGRGVRQHRHHQGRRRLHLLGLDRLPDRRPVLLRGRARCRRRVAAPGRVARRDGRRLGPLRGLGAAAGGRDRRRARVLPSGARRWATWARSWPCSSTRTTWRRCGRTRRRWPRCRRRP